MNQNEPPTQATYSVLLGIMVYIFKSCIGYSREQILMQLQSKISSSLSLSVWKHVLSIPELQEYWPAVA